MNELKNYENEINTLINDFRKKLQKYNWSSDKNYQLAVIAFKDILPTYTAQKELEARIKIIGVINNKITDYCCNNYLNIIRCYLDQLSSQLKESL